MTEPTTSPPDWRHLLGPELWDEVCASRQGVAIFKVVGDALNAFVESGVLHIEYRTTMNPKTYAMNGPREQRIVGVWTAVPEGVEERTPRP